MRDDIASFILSSDSADTKLLLSLKLVFVIYLSKDYSSTAQRRNPSIDIRARLTKGENVDERQ
jgi:hypothetical protein